jgi:hypothetical protein
MPLNELIAEGFKIFQRLRSGRHLIFSACWLSIMNSDTEKDNKSSKSGDGTAECTLLSSLE